MSLLETRISIVSKIFTTLFSGSSSVINACMPEISELFFLPCWSKALMFVSSITALFSECSITDDFPAAGFY